MAELADGGLARATTPSNVIAKNTVAAHGASAEEGDNKFQKAISAWRSTR
jgi:homeobox protein cut-like